MGCGRGDPCDWAWDRDDGGLGVESPLRHEKGLCLSMVRKASNRCRSATRSDRRASLGSSESMTFVT